MYSNGKDGKPREEIQEERAKGTFILFPDKDGGSTKPTQADMA
jgi:hypothetical protein